MQKIIIKSPAKINFGLNIVSKREDGFHNIETIFYPLNLCDIITFEKSDSFSFETSSASLNGEWENNLVVKAVRMIEAYTGRKINVSINLEKIIPIGAGLGGGSSDAAHTLLSINELFSLNIPYEKIKAFALHLGSDVPFFLHPHPSFACQRGEELHEIKFNITKPILLINPGIHISTKWAYENITPKKPEFSLSEIKNLKQIGLSNLQGKVVNDFENIVFAAYSEIKEIKNTLISSGALFALMSGSGSTIFGIFNSVKEAKSAEKIFSDRYFTFINKN